MPRVSRKPLALLAIVAGGWFMMVGANPAPTFTATLPPELRWLGDDPEAGRWWLGGATARRPVTSVGIDGTSKTMAPLSGMVAPFQQWEVGVPEPRWNLGTPGHVVMRPVVSADGRWAALVDDTALTLEVYSAAEPSGPAFTLRDLPADQRQWGVPVFHGDSLYLSGGANTAPDHAELVARSLPRGTVRWRVRGVAASQWALSPDGRALGFVRQLAKAPVEAVVVDSFDGKEHRVVRLQPNQGFTALAGAKSCRFPTVNYGMEFPREVAPAEQRVIEIPWPQPAMLPAPAVAPPRHTRVFVTQVRHGALGLRQLPRWLRRWLPEIAERRVMEVRDRATGAAVLTLHRSASDLGLGTLSRDGRALATLEGTDGDQRLHFYDVPDHPPRGRTVLGAALLGAAVALLIPWRRRAAAA